MKGVVKIADQQHPSEFSHMRRLLPEGAAEDLAAVEEAFPGTSMEVYLADGGIRALHPTQQNVRHAKLTGLGFQEIAVLNEETIPGPLAKALFIP